MRKKVLIGICGGIAAYKSIEIIRQLQKNGFECQAVITGSAKSFVSVLTLEAITKNIVISSLFELDSQSKINHIEIAQSADIFLIAPATANIIGKIANGIADDMLTTMFIATTARQIIAPAMNFEMWNNSIVKKNIQILKDNNCKIVDPEPGYLACDSIGDGRLAEINSIVNQSISNKNNNGKLNGINCLVTLGSTIQPIDPFRFITNYSSGKTGFHIIDALLDESANVSAIIGRVTIDYNLNNVNSNFISTTDELEETFNKVVDKNQIIIMVAAVSDYKIQFITNKIKQKELSINLSKSNDIIKSFSIKKPEGVITVAFAAETEITNAEIKRKLYDKNLDLLIVNKIDANNIGFAVDENEVSLIGKDFHQKLPLLHKKIVAKKIVEKIIEIKGNYIQ